MKLLNRCMVVFVVLLTCFNTCPQGLLINLNCEFIEYPIIVDKIIKEKNRYLTIDVKIPQINGLIKKDEEKVINSKILDFTTMWISDVKEIADEYYGPPNNLYPTFPYELIGTYTLKSSGEILSFYIDYYQFTGGAHGITNRVAYNIDINSGRDMLLGDLFKDKHTYEKLINKEIEKEIAKNADNYFIGKDGFNGIKKNQRYYIEDNNIVVYFGEYEIAPYATGMPQFKIPLELFGDSYKYRLM
ncbi:MAG: DUF3298 and DUF4163 domain-containing protein [Clostridium sp.]